MVFSADAGMFINYLYWSRSTSGVALKTLGHKVMAKSGSKETLHSISFSFNKCNNEQVVIPTATGKKAKSGFPKLLKRDAQWSL